MRTAVVIRISIGELVDRLTILSLKVLRLENGIVRDRLIREAEELEGMYDEFRERDPEITLLRSKLLKVNTRLWHLEDKVRLLERSKKFDSGFITSSRKIYRYNEIRAALKLKINKVLNDTMEEVKIYTRD